MDVIYFALTPWTCRDLYLWNLLHSSLPHSARTMVERDRQLIQRAKSFQHSLSPFDWLENLCWQLFIDGQIHADKHQTSAHKSKPSATAKDGQNTHWPSQWSHQDRTCKRQLGLLQRPRGDIWRVEILYFGEVKTLWVSANLTAAQAPLECPMMIVFSSTPNSSFMKGSQMELKTETIITIALVLQFQTSEQW